MMRRFALLLLMFLIWGAWRGEGAHGAVTIRIGIAGDEDGVRGVAAVAFRDATAVLTRGRGRVFIAGPALWSHPGASELELVRAVAAGDPPLALVSSASLSNFCPDLDLLDAPYLFNDRRHLTLALYGPAGRAILDSLQSRGLVGMAFIGANFRILLGKSALPVTEGLSGNRVGTVQSSSGGLFVEALGGEAVPAPLVRLPDMVANGFVDGADIDPCRARDSGLSEVASYAVDTRHAVSSEVLIANATFLDELDPAERTALWSAALAAMRAANTRINTENTAERTRLRALGRWTEVNAADRGALVARTRAARREVMRRLTPELIQAVEQAGRP